MNNIEPRIQATRVVSKRQFGLLLASARHTTGMSQQTLAAQIGAARNTVTARENGIRSITVDEAVNTLERCGYALVMIPIDQAPGVH